MYFKKTIAVVIAIAVILALTTDAFAIAAVDWTRYLPIRESQQGSTCQTYAMIFAIEMMMQMQLNTGKMPEGDADWLDKNGYIIKKGLFRKIQLDKRWIYEQAQLDNASYFDVVNAVRKYGIIPKRAEGDLSPWTGNEKRLGLEFRKRIMISFRKVIAPQVLTETKLEFGPIVIITQVDKNKWNDEKGRPVKKLPNAVSGEPHFSIIYGIDENGNYKNLDSNSPFFRILDKKYDLGYGYRIRIIYNTPPS